MKICDLCKKDEVDYTINLFLDGGTGVWEYEICKSCSIKIKKFIQDLNIKG